MLNNFNKITSSDVRPGYNQLRNFITHGEEEKILKGNRLRNSISKPEELLAYNARMRQAFIDGIGGLPMWYGDLAPQITRRTEYPEFTLEGVIFQSRPNVWVTGSMYLPKGLTAPAPAVLFTCGHSADGRMYTQYQIVCQTLARAGLIVFAMDPTGQGERSNFYDPETNTYLTGRSVADHCAAGYPAIALGQCLIRYFIADIKRAVDYLQTRPEIDPNKIGITGNSGGGTQTMAAMACEDRFAAAVPGTFTSTNLEIILSGQPQDAEQIWYGINEIGFEHVNPILLTAPRPVQIAAVNWDFFPIEGTIETYELARHFYAMLGCEDNIRMVRDNATHAYTHNLAIRSAEFFTEILCGKKITVTNADIVPLKPEEMFATTTGNVLGSIPGAVPLKDELRVTANDLRQVRQSLPKEERLSAARSWLQEKVMKNRSPYPFYVRRYERKDCTFADGCIGIPISWWNQKKLFSAGTLIRKEDWTAENYPTVLAVWDDGTNRIEDHATWILSQCEAGKQVLVLDLPGTGKLAQEPMYGNRLAPAPAPRALFSPACNLANHLFYGGDSMAALSCYDVLRAVQMLQEELDVRIEDISLYCDGSDGIIGIMAGFLQDIPRTYGKNILRNLEETLIQAPVFTYDNTLCHLIPGMLQYFDIDEIM